MLHRLRLSNYKAFDRFEIIFSRRTTIVGPNNAGKSTMVEVLRTSNQMIRHASRRRTTELRADGGDEFPAHSLDADRFGLREENVRHDFRPVPARFELTLSDGAELRAVWPPTDEDTPFFYLLAAGGQPLEHPNPVHQSFSEIGIIPTLRPLEDREEVLQNTYVRRNMGGRLTSRHFRNQLRLLDEEGRLPDFLSFCDAWLPELTLSAPSLQYEFEGTSVDIFFRENQIGGSEKELSWAGDGVQIYLQLLFHVYEQTDSEVLVVDEPEVYLHADLQRRLFRLLDSLPAQLIMATHSAEIVMEAPQSSVTWVDKSRNKAIRAPEEETLAALLKSLGSHANLRLASALRTSVALFVEGNDMRILKNLAATTGAEALAEERGLTVIPLGGADNRTLLSSFSWLADHFLTEKIESWVLLDRDYRSDASRLKLIDELKRNGLHAHVWERKELENYLLSPGAVARVTGTPLEDVTEIFMRSTDSLRNGLRARLAEVRAREGKGQGIALSTLILTIDNELEGVWHDLDSRLALCPGKALLSEINRTLQHAGRPAASARALSLALTLDEIPDEMTRLFLQVEELLNVSR